MGLVVLVPGGTGIVADYRHLHGQDSGGGDLTYTPASVPPLGGQWGVSLARKLNPPLGGGTMPNA